jgi:hypothetical protein
VEAIIGTHWRHSSVRRRADAPGAGEWQREARCAPIPVTLHDSLMARLDRLGTAKEVAQVGAVIGGEFFYELIRPVHPITEDDLQKRCARWEVDLLYVRGLAPEATYQFQRAPIWDGAYGALLKSRRKRTAPAIGAHDRGEIPGSERDHLELLAHYWAKVDETEHAIAEWEGARQQRRAMLSGKRWRVTNHTLLGQIVVRAPRSTDLANGGLRRPSQRVAISLPRKPIPSVPPATAPVLRV